VLCVEIAGDDDAGIRVGPEDLVYDELKRLCEQHPLRERLWELRMLALTARAQYSAHRPTPTTRGRSASDYSASRYSGTRP
jgi:hypothetical protein